MSRISEGCDHEFFTEAKGFFFQVFFFNIGLSCNDIFVDIQCCPLEIFAIKKTSFLFFFGIVA